MVDYCGFDGIAATVESGAGRINHVLIAPRASSPHAVSAIEVDDMPHWWQPPFPLQ
jgi:hypothetical protein